MPPPPSSTTTTTNPNPSSNQNRTTNNNNPSRNSTPSNTTNNNNNIYTLFKRSHPYLITLLFTTAKLTHPLLILSLSLNTNFFPLMLSHLSSSSSSSSISSWFGTPGPSTTKITQLDPRSLLRLRTAIWYFASLSFWSRHVVAVLGVRWLISRTRTDEQQQETPENQ